ASLLTPGISMTTVRDCSSSKISVVGTNTRTGIVGSSFFCSSRFSCTCSSCPAAIAHLLSDLNGPGLIALGSGNEEGENAVAVLGFDPIGIDADRQRYRAVERTCHALAAV